MGAQPCQDGRLVARARPDLEDPVPRADVEVLGHRCDHERLADRLAGFDREGLVGVGLAAQGRRDERLARDRAHGGKHTFVRDAARSKLVGDHRGPGLRWVWTRTGCSNGHASEDTPHDRPSDQIWVTGVRLTGWRTGPRTGPQTGQQSEQPTAPPVRQRTQRRRLPVRRPRPRLTTGRPTTTQRAGRSPVPKPMPAAMLRAWSSGSRGVRRSGRRAGSPRRCRPSR